MAIKPNTTYKINGVLVNEKIIPDGTVWKDGTKAKKAGFSKGSLYKKQKKLTNGTGKALYITVHNTKGHSGIDDEGELYTRATYNENMSSARVHFYVDANGAWQNLKAGTGMCANDPEGSAEIGWHAGDGSAADGGNCTSIGLEIIMGEKDESINKAAYDNGARLIAWLIEKHGLTIDDVVSHTYWVNKLKKKVFTDRDKQSTNIISGQKWCPAYIFDSNNKDTALKNWKKFKALICEYLSNPDNSGTDTDNSETDKKEDETPKGECEVKLSVLKKGNKGDEVKALQILLIGYGFSCGSSGVDGSFGPATQKAVKAYQTAKKLSVDGSVGTQTWTSLLKG